MYKYLLKEEKATGVGHRVISNRWWTTHDARRTTHDAGFL